MLYVRSALDPGGPGAVFHPYDEQDRYERPCRGFGVNATKLIASSSRRLRPEPSTRVRAIAARRRPTLRARRAPSRRPSRTTPAAAVAALALAVLAIGPGVAQAAMITVSTTTDEVNTDGDCSLREAVVAANTDAARDACTAGTGADVINVPAGTYTLSLAGGGENAAATGDLDLTDADGVAIQGAGSATTIIDGDRIDRVFEARPGITISTTSRISDVTVREGASVAPPTGGGGIRATGANTSLIVDDAIVTENTAVQGGGIDAEGGAGLTVTDSAVTHNTTTRLSGGGIFFADGTASIEDTTIRANTAQAIVPGIPNTYGGGISLLAATTTISGSTISVNRAAGAAPDDAGPGGAGGGGISNAEGSSLEVTNSTISNNVLTGVGGSGGGGIDNGAFPGTLLAPTPSTAVLRHVTLADNSAPIGANLRSKPGTGTNSVTTRATIASNPLGGTNCDGASTSQGFNLEFPGASCGFEIAADPGLAPLADNGGPTETRALGSASAAIDAVQTGCPPPDLDQRGVTRPLNGDGAGQALCDVGAFEQAARAPAEEGGSPGASPPGGGTPGGDDVPRVRPNVSLRVASARQRGRRIRVKATGVLSNRQGRPCAGRIAVGVRSGGARRDRRIVKVNSSCRYTVKLSYRVRSLPRRLRPRARRLLVRVAAGYKGTTRLLPAKPPSALRRVIR